MSISFTKLPNTAGGGRGSPRHIGAAVRANLEFPTAAAISKQGQRPIIARHAPRVIVAASATAGGAQPAAPTAYSADGLVRGIATVARLGGAAESRGSVLLFIRARNAAAWLQRASSSIFANKGSMQVHAGSGRRETG